MADKISIQNYSTSRIRYRRKLLEIIIYPHFKTTHDSSLKYFRSQSTDMDSLIGNISHLLAML